MSTEINQIVNSNGSPAPEEKKKSTRPKLTAEERDKKKAEQEAAIQKIYDDFDAEHHLLYMDFMPKDTHLNQMVKYISESALSELLSWNATVPSSLYPKSEYSYSTTVERPSASASKSSTTSTANGTSASNLSSKPANGKRAASTRLKTILSFTKQTKQLLGFIVGRFVYEIGDLEFKNEIDLKENIKTKLSKTPYELSKHIVRVVEQHQSYLDNKTDNAVHIDGYVKYISPIFKPRSVKPIENLLLKYFDVVANHIAKVAWFKRTKVDSQLIRSIMVTLDSDNGRNKDMGLYAMLDSYRALEDALNPQPSEEEKKAAAAKRKPKKAAASNGVADATDSSDDAAGTTDASPGTATAKPRAKAKAKASAAKKPIQDVEDHDDSNDTPVTSAKPSAGVKVAVKAKPAVQKKAIQEEPDEDPEEPDAEPEDE